MPSPVRKKYYGSVTIFWLDKEALLRSVQRAVVTLVQSRCEVKLVKLFGSFAKGTATAASDVDIMIIVKDSRLRLLDRPIAYLPYFSDIGMPVELFVYTQNEIETNPSSIAEVALNRGITLWPAHA